MKLRIGRHAVLCTVVPVILALIMLVVGCQQQPVPYSPPPPSPTEEVLKYADIYVNSKYGFSVNYCKDWDVLEDYIGMTVAFMAPLVQVESDLVSIYITVDQLSKNATLEDYVGSNKKVGEERLVNYDELNEYATTISGVPATVLTFSFTYETENAVLDFKDILAMLVKDGVGYSITYDVLSEFHDDYVDWFDLAIYTFRLD